MSERVVVSVLVPVLDEAKHLERSLARIRGQDLSGRLEILCLDGGSCDGSRMILEQAAAADARVRILDNPRRFIPNALNIGLCAARGEYVARMDAHTVYGPDYLSRGVERLKRGDAVWVSGPQLPEGHGRWSRRVALALGTPLGMGGAQFRRLGPETEVDTGFAGVWRRETLVAQGGWDEDWPINEDGELAARVRASGGLILCLPEMAASYVPRDSLERLAKQYFRYGQYRVKTSRRHPESMRRSHVLAPALVLVAVATGVPGRQRGLARVGVGIWSAAVVATTFSVRVRGASTRDAAAVPLVLMTMHLAWGTGFWLGCARFGVPWAALARLAGSARRARSIVHRG